MVIVSLKPSSLVNKVSTDFKDFCVYATSCTINNHTRRPLSRGLYTISHPAQVGLDFSFPTELDTWIWVLTYDTLKLYVPKIKPTLYEKRIIITLLYIHCCLNYVWVAGYQSTYINMHETPTCIVMYDIVCEFPSARRVVM